MIHIIFFSFQDYENDSNNINSESKSNNIWNTVTLGDKERFNKEQIIVKEQFPVTNLPVYFIRIRNI